MDGSSIDLWAAEHEVFGGWTLQDIPLAGRGLQLLLPADPDQHLEQIETLDEASQVHFDPFWAKLWPAAITLSATILRTPWPPQTRALELGCGVGLVGVAAMAAGLNVTLSDYVPLALKTALENARRNGLAAEEGMLLDWTRPPRLAFPWVFACDVLYDNSLHAPLLNTLQAVLADEGEAWIADPGRNGAERFSQMAPDWGFSLRWFDAEDGELPAPPGSYCRIVVRRSRPSG